MSPHYPHSNSDRIPYFKIVKHHLQVNTNWLPISSLGSNLHLRIARQELFMVSIGKQSAKSAWEQLRVSWSCTCGCWWSNLMPILESCWTWDLGLSQDWRYQLTIVIKKKQWWSPTNHWNCHQKSDTLPSDLMSPSASTSSCQSTSTAGAWKSRISRSPGACTSAKRIQPSKALVILPSGWKSTDASAKFPEPSMA